MNGLISALLFILQSLLYITIMVLLLRFLIQAVKADYFNPIVQGVVKLTNPLLLAPRAIFKALSLHRHDFAALLVAWVLAGIYIYALGTSGGFDAAFNFGQLAGFAGFVLLNILLDLYFFFFIIIVIASWLATGTHPALQLLEQIVHPVLSPLRRLIPSVGGLDFSVLVAILLLSALQRHILPSVQAALLS